MPVDVPSAAAQDSRPVYVHSVSHGYFDVIGIPLLRGRKLTEEDVAGARKVAVVNEQFAARYFPGETPIGRTVRLPRADPNPTLEIVGVSAGRINDELSAEIRPEVFLPFTVLGSANSMVVRTAGDALSVANSVRAVVHSVDREQPVMEIQTAAVLIDRWLLSEPRFGLLLLGLFAGLGLVLAVVGVFGVMSNSVARRTQEIGLRMALGPTPGRVMRYILVSGAIVIGTGIAAGTVSSILAVRALQSMAPNVAPLDPLSLIGVAALMAAAGVVACLIPAWRASRVDPLTSLRVE